MRLHRRSAQRLIAPDSLHKVSRTLHFEVYSLWLNVPHMIERCSNMDPTHATTDAFNSLGANRLVIASKLNCQHVMLQECCLTHHWQCSGCVSEKMSSPTYAMLSLCLSWPRTRSHCFSEGFLLAASAECLTLNVLLLTRTLSDSAHILAVSI